ncbi:MAG: bifunctional riboflavin kinase/FAD synthetase [Myxococcales bacterium]
MRLIPLDNTTFPADRHDTMLVIGNFDGVHRGHQAVLREAMSLAAAHALLPAVLSFDPHPAAVVGAGAPPLLTTLERRSELLGKLGIERLYARHFDRDFAGWSPERFVRDLVFQGLSAKMVFVGDNFRFGARRRGDLALLRDLGDELGFEACVHGIASDTQGAFSSTRVRQALQQGHVEEAAEVLGRPHAITGTVVRGAGRGRLMGFPTANLEGISELLPPNGVYAVAVDELGRDGPRALAHGVMNIGVRPTLDGEPRLCVEPHLFDLSRELYGVRLRVGVIARLRKERRFESLEALRGQITLDSEEARRRLHSVAAVDGSFT